MRGYRQLEKQFIAEGGVIAKHYWVEVNGYVFNDNERGHFYLFHAYSYNDIPLLIDLP